MRLNPLFLTLALACVAFAVQGQPHQRRLVVTGGTVAPFDFDPLTNRYLPGSLSPLKAFVDQWRKELGAEQLFLVHLPVNRPTLGYRIYAALEDSTLDSRARTLAGYVEENRIDSVLNIFGLTRSRATDSLRGKLDRWLVSDCYTVEGQSGFQLKWQPIQGLPVVRRETPLMADDERRVRQFFQTPATQLDTMISIRDSYFGPSAFARLFHRFQLDVVREAGAPASISLFAPPRADGALESGSRYWVDFMSLFSFDNQLVVVRPTGEQLHEFMEQVYGMRYFTLQGPESDLVRTKVPYYLYDDVAGLRYRVDLTQRSGRRVTIYETETGVRFDPKATYAVVLNSFRARYFTDLGVSMLVIADDYRMALAHWLAAHPTLSPRATDNWSVGPERWVRAIAARERRTVFDNP